jgi:hypothetical protein
MRRQPEFFDDAELELVYMAARLRDGLRVESLLTDAGIEYLVETGTYTAGFLLRRDLTGAFFYVLPKDATPSRSLLIENGFRPYNAA